MDLRHPAILISVYSASIAEYLAFTMNISIQATFIQPPYSFATIIVGLLYIPPSLGYFSASLLGGRWIDYIMTREAVKAGRYGPEGQLLLLPEDRMRENIWLAATLYPGALIWYSWSVDMGLPWIVSAVANFLFGCGLMLAFGAVTTMLTEFTPHRSSSAVAMSNFVRYTFACVSGVSAQPMIRALGNGMSYCR